MMGASKDTWKDRLRQSAIIFAVIYLLFLAIVVHYHC